ncbi:MAG: nicotinamide-nucleotide amidohydrolase family protein [Actinomycetales bacterium]|jgi:nicotinamide-nucleotide amidase|uniref:Nicotinamide-nucleotide amidohydrolase family protein n=1 Tax=Candidatus Phosphoribacter hodrii TaxID=2953743 RepID=A0A935IL74_9MICO|nr:nicotinamide-nucleotide amidohydrolase family protein [Candidatus Phosphoribacter hodrii]HBX80879.1 competence protein [Propionibacteriaceae bacterium]HBY24735.1 competence protein [Propionibacteriaceae bacterium]
MTAAEVLAELERRGETIGCAESLTGGALTARLIDVPGASRVVRGGIVAYASDIKAAVLAVPAERLATHGAVDPQVAAAMAQGVCRVLSCNWGVATTGVAGPEPSDGKPVGTAYIAVVRAGGEPVVRELHLGGDRAAIRSAVVEAAMNLVDAVLRAEDAR